MGDFSGELNDDEVRKDMGGAPLAASRPVRAAQCFSTRRSSLSSMPAGNPGDADPAMVLTVA